MLLRSLRKNLWFLLFVAVKCNWVFEHASELLSEECGDSGCISVPAALQCDSKGEVFV
jgi:hypothetical protein